MCGNYLRKCSNKEGYYLENLSSFVVIKWHDLKVYYIKDLFSLYLLILSG